METPNPATPAKAATPGNGQPEKTQPSSSFAPATQNGTQGNAEGKVTISTKEYADLQRAKARSLSFDRRSQFNSSRNNPSTRPASGVAATPEAEAVASAEDRAVQAERRALQSEVRDNVRDILAKAEYQNIPASTRDLILKNPQMLSNADNLEEALLDIEDFLIEESGKIEAGGDNITVVNKGPEAAARHGATTSHEVPATSASGAATPSGSDLEDTSNLTGSARSRAILRNSMKKSKSAAQ